jgi:hypothetical protein
MTSAIWRPVISPFTTVLLSTIGARAGVAPAGDVSKTLRSRTSDLDANPTC